MFGKHYLVSSSAHPSVKRHYTICNIMNPKISKSLLATIDDALNGKTIQFDPSLLSDDNQTDLWLTLKNYGFPNGVSTQIYQKDEKSKFMIKGPMGKGLQLG